MKRFTIRRVSSNPWNVSAVVVDRETGKIDGPFSPETVAKRIAAELNEDNAVGYATTSWFREDK